MGANEDELQRIASMGHFKIAELSRLRVALSVLQDTMKNVAGNSGWTGTSQEAAAEQLGTLSTTFSEVEILITQLEGVIGSANDSVNRAVESMNGLPDSKVPSWVHGALNTAEKTIPFPGLGPVLVGQGSVAVIEQFLGNQREEKAGAVLSTYQAELADHAAASAKVRRDIADVRLPEPPQPPPPPPPPGPGDRTGGGPGPVGPTFSGNSSLAPAGVGHGGSPGLEGDPIYDPGPNPDDGGPGYAPPTSTDPGSVGGGGGGGGVSPVVGSVVGGGAGMAGALTSARMGGGLGGNLPTVGAAPRLGSGGLLGTAQQAGGKGAGGAGVAGGGSATGGGSAGARSGAGTRGGLSGAGSGAHGDKEKKRRAGVGLGGPIAPKLDDDESFAPRAAGTRAGGRDEAGDFADLDDADGGE